MRITREELLAIKAVYRRIQPPPVAAPAAPRPGASLGRLSLLGILAGGSTAYLSARRNGQSRGEAGNEAVRGMLPGVAMTAVAPALMRYAPHVARVAARGNLAVLGGLAVWNGSQAAVTGWRSGGAAGAMKGFGLGVADTATFGAASAVGAYFDARARDMAQAAPVRPVASRGLPMAPQYTSDGMTAAHQRIDKRSGRVAAVSAYRTPTWS